MRDVYEVLKEKGITLPQPPAKGGVYTPVQELGEKFLYCSGCGPDLGNGNTVVGKLGKDLTVEDGQKAAYNCVLMQPQVVNGGSNLIAGLFGEEAGLPARSAIGTNALPGGIACEIEVLVELK